MIFYFVLLQFVYTPSLPKRKIPRIQTKKKEKLSNMKIAALSMLAVFATVVTSIRSLTLDERIDWGNSSDFKGRFRFITVHSRFFYQVKHETMYDVCMHLAVDIERVWTAD